MRAKEEKRAWSVGVVGNAAEVFPELLRRGVPIDIVTDQTSAHDPLSYLPEGIALEDWHDYAEKKPEEFTDRARASMARHVQAMVEFQDGGAEVFDYGNSIRDEARLGGYDRAFEFPGFVPAYIRPLFCEGKGPFRWAALSGDPEDIAATDRAVLDLFPDNDRLHKWIRGAQERDGLPGAAGADLLARLRRAGQGRAAVQRAGGLGRDLAHRSSSGATTSTPVPWRAPTARPRRWPTAPTRLPTGRCSTRSSTRRRAPRGCPSTTAAASASAARSMPGRCRSPTAPTLAAEKLARVLTNDPGMGVIRHVDAGYERAEQVARERGVRVPMKES